MKTRIAGVVGLLVAGALVTVPAVVPLSAAVAPTIEERVTALETALCRYHPEDDLCLTPTPSPSATPSPLPSGSPVPTPTATPSPTTTASPTGGPTPTPMPTPSPTSTAVPPSSSGFILIARDELLSLPTSGAAWANLRSWADRSASSPNLSDQDDPDNVIVLAKALVYARTGDAAMRSAVLTALGKIRGTESSARALALGRELGAYVLAADLIGYRDPAFVSWVGSLRTFRTGSGPASLVACHEERPNNWGTHCGATRVIVDLYIGDTADLARATTVFRGWLGDRSAYAGFSWGDLSWQSDRSKPVGINPAGATISGRDVDGVLPDDQRRAGGFKWPPPCENYVHEALQGVTLTAALVDGWEWSDEAIVRAYDWLYANGCPATGDDRFTPYIVNHFAGTDLPEPPAQPGKGFGFSDWLWP